MEQTLHALTHEPDIADVVKWVRLQLRALAPRIETNSK